MLESPGRGPLSEWRGMSAPKNLLISVYKVKTGSRGTMHAGT